MNRFTAALALLTILTVGSSPAFAQRGRGRFNDPSVAANGWRTSYDSALEEAARTRKPLMLVFRCVP